jgi:hypothetical protein
MLSPLGVVRNIHNRLKHVWQWLLSQHTRRTGTPALTDGLQAPCCCLPAEGCRRLAAGPCAPELRVAPSSSLRRCMAGGKRAEGAEQEALALTFAGLI